MSAILVVVLLSFVAVECEDHGSSLSYECEGEKDCGHGFCNFGKCSCWEGIESSIHGPCDSCPSGHVLSWENNVPYCKKLDLHTREVTTTYVLEMMQENMQTVITSVYETLDNDYIACGYWKNDTSLATGFLTKWDEKGTFVWTKKMENGIVSFQPVSVVEGKGRTTFMLSSVTFIDQPEGAGSIAYWDEDANLLWAKIVHFGTAGIACAAASTSDGNFVFVGYRQYLFIIGKFDTAGNIVWFRTAPDDQSIPLRSAIVLGNPYGGAVFTAQTPQGDTVFGMISSQGTVTFAGSANDKKGVTNVNMLVALEDKTTYISAGLSTTSDNQGETYVSAWSSNGTLLWTQIILGQQFTALTATPDGGFLTTTISNTDGTSTFIKWSSNGTVEWARTPPSNHIIRNIICTSDGGYMGVGMEGTSAVMVKMDNELMNGCSASKDVPVLLRPLTTYISTIHLTLSFVSVSLQNSKNVTDAYIPVAFSCLSSPTVATGSVSNADTITTILPPTGASSNSEDTTSTPFSNTEETQSPTVSTESLTISSTHSSAQSSTYSSDSTGSSIRSSDSSALSSTDGSCTDSSADCSTDSSTLSATHPVESSTDSSSDSAIDSPNDNTQLYWIIAGLVVVVVGGTICIGIFMVYRRRKILGGNEYQLVSEEAPDDDSTWRHEKTHTIIQCPSGNRYLLLNKVTSQEASRLLVQTGIEVKFDTGRNKSKFVLGQGQFGKLRLALHERNGQFVGVKKIKGAQKMESSLQEGHIQQELSGSPNLMPLLDFVQTKGSEGQPVLYQFMPLAGFGNGILLRNALKAIQEAELKMRVVFHVARNLIAGVQAMHERGYYHLDIKPSNIVFDKTGRLFVIDFGCTRHLVDNNRITDGGNGDARYFSPERLAHFRFLQNQIEGKGSGPQLEERDSYDASKADAWAVGITLLESITGAHPLNADANFAHCVHHWDSTFIATELNKIEDLKHPRTRSLWRLIKDLLMIHPEERFDMEEAGSAVMLIKDFAFATEAELQMAFARLKTVELGLKEWYEEEDNVYGNKSSTT